MGNQLLIDNPGGVVTTCLPDLKTAQIKRTRRWLAGAGPLSVERLPGAGEALSPRSRPPRTCATTPTWPVAGCRPRPVKCMDEDERRQQW